MANTNVVVFRKKIDELARTVQFIRSVPAFLTLAHRGFP